jgi:glycosyltransferase involved in cell wall biosynthesis
VSVLSVRRKLERREPLDVLFVNDLGFQYGAGIAHLRQIQSFVLAGHRVSGLCWAQGPEEEAIPLVPPGARGAWLGMQVLDPAGPDPEREPAAAGEAIAASAARLGPDLIVVGNLHAARWPVGIFRALARLDALVVAFMHDCHLATGRCAYPEECRLLETGCDATCPTAGEYPALDPARIAGAWRLRREIFGGPSGLPLACNSRWTLEVARRGLGGPRLAEVVYYGLDDRLFRPVDRALARRLLGLPADRLIVLGGAVNVAERRKGGAAFREVAEQLGGEALCVVFGAEAGGSDRIVTTDLVRDYRKMPLLYSAADLFVGTALEEAFGQTLCEAAACGLPIVAFEAGGVPEIARHDCNARLVPRGDVPALVAEVRALARDPERRAALGGAGRALVAAEFSLATQAERWGAYLRAASAA